MESCDSDSKYGPLFPRCSFIGNGCAGFKEKTSLDKRTSAKFILGRERFAQISAVEGIKPTAAMKKRAAEFERHGLSPAERRREIIKIYRKG